MALAVIIGVALTAGTTSETGPGGAASTKAPSPAPSPAPEVACGAERPEEADPQTYASPPPMTIDKKTDLSAVVTTSCGDIVIDLLEKESPKSVNNFVFLAEEGFYDGLTFHRIEQNSVIQGGSPDGTARGDAGYTIPDEFPKNPKGYVFGTVAMANEGPGSASSQFFIVVHDPDPKKGYEPAGYRPDYSIFGKVDPDDTTSTKTLEEIATLRTKLGDDPVTATTPVSNIYIESVEIEES